MLFHTAFGLTAHERALARGLVRAGFACLVVRYAGRTSGAVLGDADARRALERVAEDALAHLGTLPPVDSSRLAIVGLSLGGFLAVHAAARVRAPSVRAVAVLYGIYPASLELVEKLRAPLLVLQGARDAATFVSGARAVATLRGGLVARREVHVYHDAVHQFDLVQPWSESSRNAWRHLIDFLRTNV